MNVKKLLSRHLNTSSSVMIYSRANSIVVRSHPKRVKQPGTPAQQRVWNRMRLVQSFLKPLKGLLAESYREVTQKGYPYAQATKYVMQEALVEEGTSVRLDYRRCWLSLGSLDPLPELQVSWKGNSGFQVSWKVEEGSPERENQWVSLVYVTEPEEIGDPSWIWTQYDKQPVTDGVMDITEYPTVVPAETVHIYCMAHSKDRTKWAKSQYVGRLSDVMGEGG